MSALKSCGRYVREIPSALNTLMQGVVLFGAIFALWCLVTPADALEDRRRRRMLQNEGIDEDVFLAAIRAVESGDNSRAVGRHGELSAYQFTARTWSEHTNAPHLWAQSSGFADKIARKHLAWLEARLVQRRISPTVCALAGAWRYGANFPAEYGASDYATRVGALYEELRKERK